MPINTIHLNKLLRFLYLPERDLVFRLRSDIRDEIKKENGVDSGDGGHFYMPFWSDVKLHVLGQAHLKKLTDDRISKSPKKEKLYRSLEKGFLTLWDRGANQKVELINKSPRGRHFIQTYNLNIKVENVMAITINGHERLGYPYWFPDPALSKEGARIGLHIMSQALADQDARNFRIFDIIRAEFFSLENTALTGNEDKVLLENFDRISRLREKLRAEY